MTNTPKNSMIGIVLVHGVGEQTRFEHLSNEMTQLIATLKSMGFKVSVEPTTTQNSALYAQQESWNAEGVAPLRIDIRRDGHPPASIFVHEVWWADLDDKCTLWNQVKFWFWGLGMWNVRRYENSGLNGSKYMEAPAFPPWKGMEWLRTLIVRIRLWGFANVFLMSLGSISLINYLLSRFKIGELPGAGILYQYVGDVKLYQDRPSSGKGAITDVNGARRVTIRRRMIRALVDAARGGYDRWYVLAHSLGTVVAWNGLMETAHSLPNYLSKELFTELEKGALIGKRTDGKSEPTDKMMPQRPIWIGDDDLVLFREKLFVDLRGFVTYGSPLDKFAFLWPAIVPINLDKKIWHQDFEWVNVFDHTDPVGAGISAFGDALPKAGTTDRLKNFAYKASPFLLLSHIRYLKSRGKKHPDAFPKRIIEWVFSGVAVNSTFEAADKNQNGLWYPSPTALAGFGKRIFWWIAAALAMSFLVAYAAIPALLGAASFVSKNDKALSILKDFQALPIWNRMVIVFALTAGIVTLTGILRRFVERRLDAKYD